jgi:predicted patatin/cPLA2 family phospholipase
MKTKSTVKIIKNMIFVMVLLGVAGCSLSRNPVPLTQVANAKVTGMPGVRMWEIQYLPDLSEQTFESSDGSFLAISGGGANGAFGAGFLNGWTASGKRPNFRIVTGISTGALIAPLAFLGPDYDATLEKAYTTQHTKDILDVRWIFGILPLLWSESYADSGPLLHQIEQQVDEKALEAIAKEHAKGRRLYVGTTDLDAQRFIIWDMGAIANSGRPDALDMFRKVMLASASIPGVFPPVYFDVEVDGKQYDEMHVDGGTITEVFGYGSRLFRESPHAEKLRAEHCSIYVIRNGKFATEYEQVPRKITKIAVRSLSTLMKAHSWNDLWRIYLVAQAEGVDFNYVGIPDNYEAHSKEPFDPVEMKRLFDLGFDMAKDGYNWQKEPPLAGGTSGDEWIWVPSE